VRRGSPTRQSQVAATVAALLGFELDGDLETADAPLPVFEDN